MQKVLWSCRHVVALVAYRHDLIITELHGDSFQILPFQLHISAAILPLYSRVSDMRKRHHKLRSLFSILGPPCHAPDTPAYITKLSKHLDGVTQLRSYSETQTRPCINKAFQQKASVKHKNFTCWRSVFSAMVSRDTLIYMSGRSHHMELRSPCV